MRRFIALALFGGVATLVGHALVSLGLHPQQLAPVTALLQGCAVLVVGTALFATGMLGLADGYDRVATRVQDLLAVKSALEDDQAPITDDNGLAAANDAFWGGYASAGAGVGLFLAGLLGLTAALARTSPVLFTVGVLAGIICLAVVALTLCFKGLGRVRRAHLGADRSARLLERQPDARVEVPATAHPRRVPRYALFPKRASEARRLDRRLPATPAPPREPARSL